MRVSEGLNPDVIGYGKNLRSAGTIINRALSFIYVSQDPEVERKRIVFVFYVVSIIALIHDFDNDLIKIGVSRRG